MAFAHVETVSASASTSGPASVTVTSAPSVGDLVIMYVNSNGTGAVAPDAGAGAAWTVEVDEAPAGETARQVLAWKVANASEPSTFTATITAGSRWQIAIAIFSTGGTGVVVDAAATTAITSADSTTLIAEATQGVTVSADCVSFVGAGKDNLSASAAYANANNGYTNVQGLCLNQAAAVASQIYVAGKTFGASENVTIDNGGSDSMSDKTYSVHISFVEGGGAGRIMSSLARFGGLAGRGGLAGCGGGLAG